LTFNDDYLFTGSEDGTIFMFSLKAIEEGAIVTRKEDPNV